MTKTTLNCKGKLLSLHKPVVMGILNITPDSFFDGGRYQTGDTILSQVESMLKDGAVILDIGGMSSRPGAAIISVEEELKRVIPSIENTIKNFPDTIISIDTVHAKVAKEAVEAGASIVNDISAGKIDNTLYQTVADLEVPYILMHMQGKPKTMQIQPKYTKVITEITDVFIHEIDKLRTLGVKDIILDPGFGFGKTVAHNYAILKNMSTFSFLGLPMLAGISRKSMICKVLNINPQQALNGTTALHMIALQQGAKILRAHDVKEAQEVIKLWRNLEDTTKGV